MQGDIRVAAPLEIVAPGELWELPSAMKCGSCEKLGGGHYPACPLLKPRFCKGCPAEIGHQSRRAYCQACQDARCPECRTYRGRHKRSCRYLLRKRKPRLTVVREVVTEDAVLDLYLAHGAAAIRVAARVLGASEAQDIVHDVFVYILEKRRYIRSVPGRAYLFQAVRHAALNRFTRYWSRLVLLPTAAELESAQQLLARDEPDQLARLTEPE